jgi:transcriptional regulator with XRE-family HTH domain
MATQLKSIRERLGVTQENVARRTSLTTGTYRRAEDGNRVNYSTAQEILNAINSFLSEQGQPAVTLEDIGLNLT